MSTDADVIARAKRYIEWKLNGGYLRDPVEQWPLLTTADLQRLVHLAESQQRLIGALPNRSSSIIRSLLDEADAEVIARADAQWHAPTVWRTLTDDIDGARIGEVIDLTRHPDAEQVD